MPRTSKLTRLAAVVTSCGALLALAWFIYGHSLDVRPLSGDDLANLDLAGRVPAASIMRGEAAFYPEWRPLSFLALWLQYRWSGLEHVSAYFAVNLLLWAACAWLVWQLVVTLTDSHVGGFVAGWVVLADARPVYTVAWIIERQTSLACLFGLLAMLVTARDRRGALTGLEWAALSMLLLASALSKEFGLAFALAIAVSGWRGGRAGPAAAALVAVVTYTGLRLWFAGGAMSRVCEEMGYFFSTRPVCFVPVDRTAVTQVAYNIAAAGADSLLPGLLGGDGRIAVAPSHLPAAIAWLVLAVVGWTRGPRMVRVAALALAANVVLNFMLYRDRNHVIGLCAVAIAVGVGWASTGRVVAVRPSLRPWRVVALLTMLGLLAAQTVQTRRIVASVVDNSLRQDPCDALAAFPQLPAGFVARVKVKYGMSNPDCVAGH